MRRQNQYSIAKALSGCSMENESDQIQPKVGRSVRGGGPNERSRLLEQAKWWWERRASGLRDIWEKETEELGR